MNLLTIASPKERLAAAEFQRLVDEHALRWEPEPRRRYPVGEVTWPPAGWLPLVERLVRRLISLGWNRQLAQVKSKLGRMRFHIGEGTQEMFDLIDKAKERSEEEGTSVRCASHRDPGAGPSLVRLAATYRVETLGRKGSRG